MNCAAYPPGSPGGLSDRPETGPAAVRGALKEPRARDPVRPGPSPGQPEKPATKTAHTSDLRRARESLGLIWGLGRPVKISEFGRMLKLGEHYSDRYLEDIEDGRCETPGPIAVAIELMLAGIKPRHYNDVFPPRVAEVKPGALVVAFPLGLPDL